MNIEKTKINQLNYEKNLSNSHTKNSSNYNFSSELKELDENLYKDSYKSVREQIIPLMHKYCDNKASERIFEIMKGL